MPNWEKIKKNLGNIADKTVTKTKELTDTASLKIKIASKESDRDLAYKKLGKLAYVKLKQLDGYDSEEITAKISGILEELDAILADLAALKAEEEARKQEKQAEKEAKKQEKPKEETNEELNMEVMTEFNKARAVADEEYEKAKTAAEEAK